MSFARMLIREKASKAARICYGQDIKYPPQCLWVAKLICGAHILTLQHPRLKVVQKVSPMHRIKKCEKMG